MLIDNFWLGIMIAAVLSGAILVLTLKLQQTRRQQNLLEGEKQLLEARLKSLESKIELLTTGSKGIGQRLMLAEKKLHQTIERQEEIVGNNPEQLFRRQADRVLKGRPLEEEDEDSPSRSEAKLMALVGRKPQEKG